MSYRIDRIEGIGPVYAKRLKELGIARTGQLLERGRARSGRKQLSDEMPLDERVILKWVNMCDLMRIKGVAEEYSELLEAAGVDTIKELRNRNARNLAAAMRDANEARRLVRQLPGEKTVARWIEAAKVLEAMIEH